MKYGVPQGSVLRLLLFTMYTTTFSQIIDNFKPLWHCLYADDTQIYDNIIPKTTPQIFHTLKDCLQAIQKWLAENRLKLNPDKMEFMIFGSSTQKALLADFFPIDLLGSQCSPTQKVKKLRIYI